nr:hypothetical protein [Tanacetum cinerariifolium]
QGGAAHAWGQGASQGRTAQCDQGSCARVRGSRTTTILMPCPHPGAAVSMGNTMARILIVDDSPTEMYKLTGMLEKHGHEVLKAENGADGVALARQEKPDAVLMD